MEALPVNHQQHHSEKELVAQVLDSENVYQCFKHFVLSGQSPVLSQPNPPLRLAD
jgi:hypothetical protein